MYDIGDEEAEAVRKVILSKKLFRYQPGEGGECDRFEREFSEASGVAHAVLVSSGTNALVAALVALGVGDGDEVLVPAYTFVATAGAVRLAGAIPVIVNVDETLGISASEARKKITPKTKAIIPVHMDGLASDMEGVCALAREFGLVVVEDCAQAIGGSYRERRLGAWGDAGAFSLNENKNITCGEGGIAVTSRRETYERMFGLQDLSAQFNPFKKEIFRDARPALGMSMRVSEIQGAIMRVQLTRLDGFLLRLRERKLIFLEMLASVPGLRMTRGNCAAGDCASSLHLRFADPMQAGAVSKRLVGAGILAAFPTLRPAHVAWKWIELVDPAGAAAVKAELLPSMDVLMGTLKYDLNPALSLDETAELAKTMRAKI
jgi:dTDP-4-amino-4,6-dideoxygalactose transaminase